jgi:hypothetical protein
MTEPIFVKLRNDQGELYGSYADYWRLIELSGFPTCEQGEIQLDSNRIFILSPPNGNAHEIARQPRRCKLILWALERPLGGYDGYAPANYDAVWVSDRWLAGELNRHTASSVQYVPVGGHAQLGGERKKPVWDLTHQSYQTYRRQAVYNELEGRGFAISGNGWQDHRDGILSTSRAGLCVHQDELPIIEPLRMTLFSCWGLPLICEHSHDFYPYQTYPLGGVGCWSAGWDAELDGQKNRDLLTGKMNFRACVEAGVQSNSLPPGAA